MPTRDATPKTCENTSRFVYANGQRIHVVTRGEGPLVLLVHGFPEFWYSWRHQMQPFADAGYRVVAPDMRGYGRTSKPRAVHDYRITALVDDLVEVVHALGESNAVVVGHDWGALVAWTAAWMRPDVFRAVAALSVPFGGQGLMALPGDPLGRRQPSELAAEIAGPGRRFYHAYLADPTGGGPEIERDPRAWLRAALFSFSGSPPLPEATGADDTSQADGSLIEFLRSSGVCMPNGTRMADLMVTPEVLPDWITETEIDVFAAEFERTGVWGTHYYACLDLSWELLAPFAGQPITVPALYVGGDRDVATIWAREAIELFPTTVPNLHRAVVLPGCGHWTQQERPDEVTAELLHFLSAVG
ncbi:MAG: alpha/beta fold hydrolase [Mycobacterium sp.]